MRIRERFVGGARLVTWIVTAMMSGACNSILGIDEIQTDGCPNSGELDCADASTPRICKANGKWESLSPCFHQACQSGRCVGECSPGERHCAGLTPEVCDAMGQWQIQTASCSHICLDGACIGECAPGERRCDQDTPQTCNGDGTWKSANAPCTDQVCDPLTGTCRGSCSPGQSDCAGNQWRHCMSDGEFAIEPPCVHQTCDSQKGCMGECAPDDVMCEVNSLRTCKNGYWQTSVDCAAQNQTCVLGACAGQCTLGTKRCAGDRVQLCNDLGVWEDAETCQDLLHCAGGACITDCIAGDVECQGNAVYACMNGSWKTANTCVDQTCNADAAVCAGDCAPGQARCIGQTPQTCDADGNWKSLPPCVGACVDGSCLGSSCNGLPEDCGPNKNENCCVSRVIPALSFNRFNDPTLPATISEFRLDRFEVTVGRFKKFLEVYQNGMLVLSDGDGAHPKIPSSGWQSAWNGYSLYDTLQTCDRSIDHGDSLPMNCITWYAAFAFCIWDGGRLPTEVELNAAIAGGPDQRRYPWSAPPSSTLVDPSYAVYACTGDGSPVSPICSFPDDLLPVGSRSPKGDGKYGQADIGGNLFEWLLDFYDPNFNIVPCYDCVNLTPNAMAYQRRGGGGGFNANPSTLTPQLRIAVPPDQVFRNAGVRCARLP